MWMTNTAVKNHTATRELVQKIKDGMKPLDSIGIVDARLFSGSNKLIAFRDPVTLLWKVRYTVGGIPEQLKQTWTKFSYLLDYVRGYYLKRNIEIVDVIDLQESE